MTIEELLECTADELEQMTDEQLMTHLAPYLNATRPELVRAQNASKPQSSKGKSKKQNSIDIAREIMKQFDLPVQF